MNSPAPQTAMTTRNEAARAAASSALSQPTRFSGVIDTLQPGASLIMNPRRKRSAIHRFA
jgi:hypothetical protein